MGREGAGARRLPIVYVADTMASIQMLEGLARSFDVTLLVPASLGERATTFWPPGGGVRVDRVVVPGGRMAFVLRAARWLRRNRRRFAVAVALDNLGAALAANAGHLVGGPPVVLQVGRPTLEYIRCRRGEQVWWRYLLRLGVARALVAFNERRAAAIGTVSEYVAEQCRRHNRNVTAIAWQGVDTERFAAVCDKREARRLLGLPLDRPVALWRSRVAAEKDPDTFLRAVAILRAGGRDVCAAYMGGEGDEMRRRARRAGVEVVGRNAASPEEIPLWYVAADVAVQTSHAEGLGLSGLEALACETPVVVSGVGGLPEVTGGGRFGVVVPAGDAEATAAGMARYLDDPDAARAAGRAGRAFVARCYSRDRAFAAWSALVAGAARWLSGRRVLFVDHQADLKGGGERDMVDLVDGLGAFPVEVHAALPAEGPLAQALRARGVEVHLVGMGEDLRRVSRWDLARRPWVGLRHAGAAGLAAVRLARLARRLRVDVVHSHSMKAHVLAAPAARVAGVPHVWHAKDILEDGWLRRAFTAMAGATAARVVCISHAVARPFAGTRAEPRVRVVHCGLRPPRASDEAAAAARRRFGVGPGDVLIGMVGHTAWWKGHDVFVEAAARVAGARPGVRFGVVAGCMFPENEGPYDAAVRQRVVELGLADRLRWLEEVDDMAATMAAFDVFVHASRLPEPFGRVVVEAMAQGTPVVGTSVGAGPELVSPAAGVLVEPGDPDALAQALVALVDDGGKRAAMGEAARREAARFDVAVAARAFAELYEELAGEEGPVRRAR